MILPAHHHDPDQLHAAVLSACRRAGCTCTEPDLEVEEHGVHGVYVAHVSHDDGCHLLARRVAPWN